MRVELVQIKKTNVGFQTGVLLSVAKQILKDEYKPKRGKDKAVIELVFVLDSQMRSLNKQYRQKAATTDVLSFSYIDDAQAGDLIGQIIMSVPVLKKQAKEHGHAYKTELLILFVHGLLHILGFDHETKDDFEEMMKVEQKYLGDKSGLLARSKLEYI